MRLDERLFEEVNYADDYNQELDDVMNTLVDYVNRNRINIKKLTYAQWVRIAADALGISEDKELSSLEEMAIDLLYDNED